MSVQIKGQFQTLPSGLLESWTCMTKRKLKQKLLTTWKIYASDKSMAKPEGIKVEPVEM